MKKLLLVFFLVCLVVTATLAKEGKKSKKGKRRNQDERKRLEVNPRDIQEGGDNPEYDDEEDEAELVQTNPCNTKRCDRGEQCVITDGRASCQCLEKCYEELDEKYKACSTKNITFDSECHLDREHCRCRKGLPTCSHSGTNRINLDFYGPCKVLTHCPGNELNEFPARMRDWLFQVMRELAHRHQLDSYLDMLKSAGEDSKHSDAVIWKFCDLDVHPQDRHVTRRELLFVVASIKPMEHCLVPFLDKCDGDDDRTITLDEWGVCLGLDSGEIADKCKVIHDRRKN